ncbi:alpha/beta-hydrolase [Aspergillus keveii]|uniref:Alpha/beta-hydrolase n=1 Tax=Aspergillus keveii TaxID=714993 RepID=A0ABR4GK31_9EURO
MAPGTTTPSSPPSVPTATKSSHQPCPPNATFTTDSDHIHSYIESLADSGRRIFVLMHSYGGQVGTNALDKLDIASRRERGLSGGVVHVVYMAALALQVGVSMYSLTERAGRAGNLLAAQEINEDGTSMYRNVGERMLGAGGDVAVDSGMSEAEIKADVDALGTWNAQAMYGVLQRCAWRESSVSYVKALRDQVMPTSYQTKMIEGMCAAGRDIEVFELDAGHSMHVTMTSEVVEIVRGTVGRSG